MKRAGAMHRPFLRYLGAAAYVLGLALFYYKYVPLVRSYQLVLAPVLAVLVLLTIRSLKTGALVFLFLFPLINNLPYFFKLYEPLPQAPAALILALFFFLAILIRPRRMPEDEEGGNPLKGPLVLFAALVVVSATVTFLRYANFFPFGSPEIYELVTNRHGVRAGGAIMSVVFSALNYLTGIAFFLVAVRELRDAAWRRKALAVLGASCALAAGFGLFQHFGHPALANNPPTVRLGLVNGTFKDALSFGAFLSMAVPLCLAAAAAFRNKASKTLAVALAFLSVAVLPFTGSKSGVIALAAGLIVLAGLAAVNMLRSRDPNTRKRLFAAGILVLVVAATAAYSGVSYLGHLEKPPAIVERFANTKDMFGIRVALLWKNALDMIKDYPLTGVGVGAFIIELANYGEVYERPDVTPESAENHVLQVGSELGLVAVILVLVIVAVIAREARRGLSASGTKHSERYLLTGAVAGFTAFVVNAQPHSFIGSYEIKYAMWFLVALIIALAPPHPAPAGLRLGIAAGRNRTLKTAGVILLVFLGTIHLWTSTHSLSLLSRTERFGFRQEFGLDRVEKTADGREFRWTGRRAGIRLKADRPIVEFSVHAAHPDIQRRPVRLRVFVAGTFFKSWKLEKEVTLRSEDWQDISLAVPRELVGRNVCLLFEVSRTWSPLKFDGRPDSRQLGIALGPIELTALR